MIKMETIKTPKMERHDPWKDFMYFLIILTDFASLLLYLNAAQPDCKATDS